MYIISRTAAGKLLRSVSIGYLKNNRYLILDFPKRKMAKKQTPEGLFQNPFGQHVEKNGASFWISPNGWL